MSLLTRRTLFTHSTAPPFHGSAWSMGEDDLDLLSTIFPSEEARRQPY